MIVTIKGKTDVVLSMNETGIQIQGKRSAKNVDIDTPDKEQEIRDLEKSGLIEIIEETIGTTDTTVTQSDNVKDDTDDTDDDSDDGFIEDGENKSKRAPKPEVVELETETEQERALSAEAETQKENSRVVISTGDRNIESKMKKSAVGELAESEATKASLEAMKKLKEDEEEENESDGENQNVPLVDEKDLPDEEQMGRGAVVMQEGSDKKVDLANSIIPESNTVKEKDPFIDREEKKEIANAKEQSETNDKKDKKDSKESKVDSKDSNSNLEDIFAPDEVEDEDDEDEDGEDSAFIEC